MSIETTHDIKKDVAIACILARILKASNEQIEDTLRALDDSPFRNYNIVEDFDNTESPKILDVIDYLKM